MSPYIGYCIMCHRRMGVTKYPDEAGFWCFDHAYSQHLKLTPRWDYILKEFIFPLHEILLDERRTIMYRYPDLFRELRLFGLDPSDILLPREQWDYFYWHKKESALLKKAIHEWWECDQCGAIRYKEEEVRCWECGKGEMIYQGKAHV